MNPTANKEAPAVGMNRQRIMSTNVLGRDMVLGGANNQESEKFETETVNTDAVGAAKNHMQNNLLNAPRKSIQAQKNKSVAEKKSGAVCGMGGEDGKSGCFIV